MTTATATAGPVQAAAPAPIVPSEYIAFAVRAASEGIPIGVIARIIKLPYDKVLSYLQRAKQLGALVQIPKPDWPVNQPTTEREPSVSPHAYATNRALGATPSRLIQLSSPEQEFLCRHTFRLTNLEAGFLVVLLKCLFAEKEKLHAVIEQQRSVRAMRPDTQEITDPKMVDVMICKLRKKMSGHDPAFVIKTSWGKGYFLEQWVKNAIYAMMERYHDGNPVTDLEGARGAEDGQVQPSA